VGLARGRGEERALRTAYLSFSLARTRAREKVEPAIFVAEIKTFMTAVAATRSLSLSLLLVKAADRCKILLYRAAKISPAVSFFFFRRDVLSIGTSDPARLALDYSDFSG